MSPRNPTGKGGFTKGDPRINRNGQRSKAAVQFTRALREMIVNEGNKKHTITNPNTGEKVTLTKIEWVVIAAYNAAVQGDAKARDWISERTEGKVPDNFKHEGGITLTVVYDKPDGNSEESA